MADVRICLTLEVWLAVGGRGKLPVLPVLGKVGGFLKTGTGGGSREV